MSARSSIGVSIALVLLGGCRAAPSSLSVQVPTTDPAARWPDNGGNEHLPRMTEDGKGLILITTAKGHAAVAALDGIKAGQSEK